MVSCQKQPQANFYADKEEYVAGDTIWFTNTSINAKKYFWSMPYSNYSEAKDVYFYTDIYHPEDYLNFRLTAFSKNEKKSDEITKSIKINRAEGDIVFWANDLPDGNISITINGELKGSITKTYNEPPVCGSEGVVTVRLTTGQHHFKAEDDLGFWHSKVEIVPNVCNAFQLLY